MSILAVIFGILSGCFLAVLVGIIGSHRRIGFGWAFLISLIFTPLVGLIVALLTDPRTLDLLVAFFQLGNHCFELFFIRLEVA